MFNDSVRQKIIATLWYCRGGGRGGRGKRLAERDGGGVTTHSPWCGEALPSSGHSIGINQPRPRIIRSNSHPFGVFRCHLLSKPQPHARYSQWPQSKTSSATLKHSPSCTARIGATSEHSACLQQLLLLEPQCKNGATHHHAASISSVPAYPTDFQRC